MRGLSHDEIEAVRWQQRISTEVSLISWLVHNPATSARDIPEGIFTDDATRWMFKIVKANQEKHGGKAVSKQEITDMIVSSDKWQRFFFGDKHNKDVFFCSLDKNYESCSELVFWADVEALQKK